MAGKNNFAALKQYATKEYKFKQGNSIGELDPSKAAIGDSITSVTLSSDEFDGIKNGVCAALTANWLKEKLTSAKHPAFAGPSTGADVHAGRNLDTVRANVPKFLSYKEDPSTSKVLAQYGLAASAKATFINPVVNAQVSTTERSYSERTRTWTERPSTIAVPKVAESMANACISANLQEGRGVYISFSVVGRKSEKPGGRHAVAAYRSRGNTLYFFDPNCGVYAVKDPAKFFAAFVACYDGIGYDLAIHAHDRFTYVDR